MPENLPHDASAISFDERHSTAPSPQRAAAVDRLIRMSRVVDPPRGLTTGAEVREETLRRVARMERWAESELEKGSAAENVLSNPCVQVHGRRPAGARRLTVSPIIAHLISASECSAHRS